MDTPYTIPMVPEKSRKPFGHENPWDASDGLVMAPGSPLEDILRFASLVAAKSCPVFLRGESGTGKELLARFLHRRSPRPPGPFVAVNCGAISPHLIESELFGHVKGAFTGAHADNPGKFRLADGGTLFLDEVGDMPPEAQTKLLRVLQEKMVCPVGGQREHAVDFRLVCATHRDLRKAVDDGLFREDLFYRVNVVEIRIPALRARRMDIPLLLRSFLSMELSPEKVNEAMAALPPRLTVSPFPGNIRELKNLAERYGVLSDMGQGWEEALGEGGAVYAHAGAEASTLADQDENAFATALPHIRNSRVTDGEILKALGICGFHRSLTSRTLGISRRALQYRLAKMRPTR